MIIPSKEGDFPGWRHKGKYGKKMEKKKSCNINKDRHVETGDGLENEHIRYPQEQFKGFLQSRLRKNKYTTKRKKLIKRLGI